MAQSFACKIIILFPKNGGPIEELTSLGPGALYCWENNQFCQIA
jgi:hypothetical protein